MICHYVYQSFTILNSGSIGAYNCHYGELVEERLKRGKMDEEPYSGVLFMTEKWKNLQHVM